MIAKQPGDEMAEVKLLGCPWHGQVKDDLLHLPNGATMAWPQPDGVDPAAGGTNWHSGFTFRLSMPSAHEIERTVEQAAQDEAAGMQFLSSAILAGTKRLTSDPEPYLHSKAVGGWLYAAPDNTVWKMSTMGPWTWSSSTALSIDLNPRRFGAFGVPSAVFSSTVTADVTAMQQVTPTLNTEQGFRARIVDITPDGRKAIIMLYRRYSSDLIVQPIGFLLLTLSGMPGVNFSANISVLSSRNTTLGVQTVSDSIVVQGYSQGTESSETVEDTLTDFPTCGGYLRKTYTFSEVLIEGGDMTHAVNVTAASGAQHYSLVDRIVSYWFDASGTPHPVKLSGTYDMTLDHPLPTVIYSGELKLRQDNTNQGSFCLLSNAVRESSAFINTTRIGSRVAISAQTLEWSGQSVSFESRLDWVYSISVETEITGISAGVPLGTNTRDDSASFVVKVDGVPTFSEAWTEPDVTSHIDLETNIYTFSSSDESRAGMGLFIPIGFGGSLAATYPVTSFTMWSNNLISLWLSYHPDASLSPKTYRFKTLHPLGIADAVEFTTEGTPNEYGSFNPITGASVINSEDPVSWT